MSDLLPILSMESVSFAKNGRSILDQLNVSIQAGEIIIITGPSGAGKTSILRLLNRMETISSGKIFFQGRDIQFESPTALRRRVALVFQTPIFFPGTILENLQRVDHINQRPYQTDVLYREKMDWVGLSNIPLGQQALNLSLGEKQRLSVARALLNNPAVLLLDEPTSALDPEASHHLLDAVHSLHQESGMTILMVTHQRLHGDRIGSRLWTIEAGRLIRDEHLVPQKAHTPSVGHTETQFLAGDSSID